jgi:ParB-like chromosome segregation protein Spo0J
MDRIIKFVPLADIYVDLDWNSRSRHEVLSEVSDGVRDTTLADAPGEGQGLEGLRQSFQANGQDTPVVVRPVSNGRSLGGHPTTLPLELVCGFRRICAASTGIKNVPEGQILAELRELSPLDAELLNLRENTERSGVTTPDLVSRIAKLHRGGMSLNQISVALRASRPHVTLLARIGKLPQSVLDHWRGAGRIPGLGGISRRLSSQEMSGLAQAGEGKSELEIQELYKDALAPKTAVTRVEQDLVAKRLTALGQLLAELVRFEVLQKGSCEWHRVVGPKKDGFPVDSGRADAQARARYWEILQQTFEKALND